jgi:hypothetical protein
VGYTTWKEVGILADKDLIFNAHGLFEYNFHTCSVHLDVIKSFIRPNNAKLNCFKILKFTLRFTINAPTCFGLIKTSSESLQYVLC